MLTTRGPRQHLLRAAHHGSVPLVGSLLASVLISPALSQDEVELGPVVVTASGHEQQVKDAPASISVIPREKLERGQYRDVTDALRSVPGVTITGGGAGDDGADISIRGFPAAYTLLLVDGQRVDTRETRPNGSAGFEQNWLPPLQAIERIEVIRGPMSTLYGSDAMGGVINVITRKVPNEWHGSMEAAATLHESSDSGAGFQTNFYTGGPLVPDLLGMQLWGQYTGRAEDKIRNGYEDRSFKSLTGRLTLTPDPDHELTFETGYSRQDRERSIGKSVQEPCGRGGCSDSDDTHTNTHFSLSHSGRLSFGNLDSYIKHEIAENESRDIQINNTTANTSLVLPLGDHVLTLGANFQHEDLEDETTNQISDRTTASMTKYAVFAEDEWFMTDTFSLTGGIRLDYSEDYDAHVSPRLYGVWNFAPEWTLKGGVSTGYRAPSLREITPDWGQVSRGGNVYGNPDLEPEKSLNKEISLLYSGFSGVDLSLTLFHNDFKDKITRVTCPVDICPDGENQFGAAPTYRINVDEAITRGIEAGIQAALPHNLVFTGSYTYTDSEQKSGDYKGQPLTQLPKHQATAELEWQATPKLRPWTRLTFRGQESQPVEGPSSNTTTAPSYTFIDVGLGYDVLDNLTVNVGLYNLTDKTVRYDDYGYVEDGRRLWLSVKTTF